MVIGLHLSLCQMSSQLIIDNIVLHMIEQVHIFVQIARSLRAAAATGLWVGVASAFVVEPMGPKTP